MDGPSTSDATKPIAVPATGAVFTSDGALVVPAGATVITEEDVPPPQSLWRLLIAFPLGAITAAIGLAPWLVTGARLPLQNLWESPAAASAMPFVLLPFSQYYVIQIFALVVVGAAVAGLVGRSIRLRGWAIVLLQLGVLAVQVFALVQTVLVVRDGLREGFESVLYLGGLGTGAALSILVGVVVTQLITSPPRAGAVIGFTVGAIALSSWVGALIQPVGTLDNPFVEALVIVPWIAPVLAGVAIAWAGIHSVGRVVAALFSLGLIWVAPAVITAISATLGSRAMLRSAGYAVDYGIGVFQSALFTPEVALRPVVATLAVAAVGLVVRWVIVRVARRGSAGGKP